MFRRRVKSCPRSQHPLRFPLFVIKLKMLLAFIFQAVFHSNHINSTGLIIRKRWCDVNVDPSTAMMFVYMLNSVTLLNWRFLVLSCFVHSPRKSIPATDLWLIQHYDILVVIWRLWTVFSQRLLAPRAGSSTGAYYCRVMFSVSLFLFPRPRFCWHAELRIVTRINGDGAITPSYNQTDTV